MGTTPNYGWTYPAPTNYVKDLPSDLGDLADEIDATVAGLGSAGLTLIKAQTVGTGVSSVSVTDAFSSTYDNYRITWTNGTVGTNNSDLRLSLNGITTSYENSWLKLDTRSATVVNGWTGSGSSYWLVTQGMGTNSPLLSVDIYQPYLSNYKYFNGWSFGSYNNWPEWISGIVYSSASATGFTVTGAGTTLTGGTIRVYGYKNS